jgi:methylmalonyl-CoA epimerase
VLEEIDHVGIAVRDLDAAVELYRRAFGIDPVHREVVADQGVEEVLFRAGTSYLQLLGALGPETPVGRFLEKRGEGIHHVGYRVSDVGGALARLKDLGIPLVDESPRPGSRGTVVAFVHPAGMGGVLVELVQEAATAQGPGSRP